MAYVPERGDIIWTSLELSAGEEQTHKRPALVISPKPFNEHMGLALVLPITSRVRGHGFEVPLTKGTTQGAILCHEVKTIDYKARRASLIEKCDSAALVTSLSKVRLLLK